MMYGMKLILRCPRQDHDKRRTSNNVSATRSDIVLLQTPQEEEIRIDCALSQLGYSGDIPSNIFDNIEVDLTVPEVRLSVTILSVNPVLELLSKYTMSSLNHASASSGSSLPAGERSPLRSSSPTHGSEYNRSWVSGAEGPSERVATVSSSLKDVLTSLRHIVHRSSSSSAEMEEVEQLAALLKEVR